MEFSFDGPEDAGALVILAHGAGAAMDSPFMNDIARRLGERHLRVARFEFPYMAARRRGERRPPDREPVLRKSWADAVEALRDERPLFIGGKSMGGRYATMVADELRVTGVVCLGYPFHPPGKPQQLRTAHLEKMRTPGLIVQGTRDEFGTREEVEQYTLAPTIEIVWMEDGDHSLKPRKGSGRTSKEHLAAAIEAIDRFIRSATASERG